MIALVRRSDAHASDRPGDDALARLLAGDVRDASSFRAVSFRDMRCVYDATAAGYGAAAVAAGLYPAARRLIWIEVDVDGSIHLADGRHRYAVARERGATAGGVVVFERIVVINIGRPSRALAAGKAPG